jgi:hypothetical protein
MDDSSILEQQRHKVGVREAPAEATPRIELPLGQTLGAPARSFFAGERMEKCGRPNASWPLLVREIGNV